MTPMTDQNVSVFVISRKHPRAGKPRIIKNFSRIDNKEVCDMIVCASKYIRPGGIQFSSKEHRMHARKMQKLQEAKHARENGTKEECLAFTASNPTLINKRKKAEAQVLPQIKYKPLRPGKSISWPLG